MASILLGTSRILFWVRMDLDFVFCILDHQKRLHLTQLQDEFNSMIDIVALCFTIGQFWELRINAMQTLHWVSSDSPEVFCVFIDQQKTWLNGLSASQKPI